MKDVVQTTPFLSKRWQKLWLSLPCLQFNLAKWHVKAGGKWLFGDGKFMDFIDKVFLYRDNTSRIEKLTINYSWVLLKHYIENEFRFSPYNLKNAMRLQEWVSCYQIQELLLNFFHLVSNLSFGSVKKLELDSCYLLPIGGDSDDNFVFGFPNTEKLIIRDCIHREVIKTVFIDAPNLEYLSFETVLPEWRPHCALRISAPNLTSIKFLENIYGDYSLEGSASVHDVEIQTGYHTILQLGGKKQFFMHLYKVLEAVAAAQSLTITARDFQAYRRLPKGHSVSFKNLRYLKLTEWHKDGHISPIAKLLCSFPNLETLVVEGTMETELNLPNKGGDWAAQLSLGSEFSHLKSIEIRNLEGCENELIFLGFLLANAEVLENITLRAMESILEGKDKQLMDFKKNVELLPKASSKVTIASNIN